MEQKQIYWNTELLHFIFIGVNKIDWTNETHKENYTALLATCISEDKYLFLRIILYLANVRKGDKQEKCYQYMCQFLSVMYPNTVISNLHHFIRLGKKDDIIYFVNDTNVDKIQQWLKVNAKQNKDYVKLLNGNQIGDKIERQIRYLPKTKKNSKWSVLLEKIMDEPLFNGLI